MPPHQLAIEAHVIDMADDDHLRAFVADLRQRFEIVEHGGHVTPQLHHDEIRCRDRREHCPSRPDTACMQLGSHFRQTPVAQRLGDGFARAGVLGEDVQRGWRCGATPLGGGRGPVERRARGRAGCQGGFHGSFLPPAAAASG
jgi:hypothetical protein